MRQLMAARGSGIRMDVHRLWCQPRLLAQTFPILASEFGIWTVNTETFSEFQQAKLKQIEDGSALCDACVLRGDLAIAAGRAQ